MLGIFKDVKEMASKIYEGIGGVTNVSSIDNCSTRLRVEVKNIEKVNAKLLREVSGVKDVLITSEDYIQIVLGSKVTEVTEAVKALLNK